MSQNLKTPNLIKTLINSSSLSFADIVEDFDVSYDRQTDDIFLNVSFKPHVPKSEKETFFNEAWKLIYFFIGVPVYLVDNSPNQKIRENEDKGLSLLEKFMSEYEIDGVCGFWVDPEEDIDGLPWVYIIFDKDWFSTLTTKPEFIVRRYKLSLKEEIKKYLGIDVQVGTTVRDCKD